MSYNINTNKYMGYIYKISNNINNKIYIGKTTRDIKTRFKQHCSKTAHKEDNSILHKAMDKYGINNFYIEEVNVVTSNTKEDLTILLNEMEKYYIDVFDTVSPNGYNILRGGENTPNNRVHEIYKFSLTGEFIQYYETISDALVSVGENNLKSTKIQYHLHTDCKAYGYLWSEDFNCNPYEQFIHWNKKNNGKKSPNKMYPKVCQYNTNKEFVSYYNTASNAAKKVLGKPNFNLYVYARGRNNHFYNDYYWYFSDDLTQPDKSKIIL